MHLRRVLCCILVLLSCSSLFAQQTGALHGRVTASDGSALPGVTVEARSNALPQPRVTTTDINGDYRLPALQPGAYTLTYTLSGMQTGTRRADALLGQDNAVDVKLGVAGVSESITVTAAQTLVNKETTAIQNGLSSDQIRALPLTQSYRDVQKLIPGVMYTEDGVRGPSAGASGQDNVYMFDGVNITMPLFGVLNAEPNTHDIAQVSIVRGAAKAIDFNRAGGFQIDSVSKSGTNKFTGEVGYQVLNKNFIADQVGAQNVTFAQNRTWTTVNLGGPIIADRLFFYGSYYRPYFQKSNQENLYGSLPKYEDKRTDEFGKLTFTPTQAILMNLSYRNSHSTETASSFGSLQAPTTGTGFDTKQKLGTLETSWILNPKSYATLKLSDWRNPGSGIADGVASVNPAFTLGTHLDINNLGTLGRFIVPSLLNGNTAQNAFVTPFINQYGYICPQNPAATGLTCVAGQRTGGGTVGFGQFARDDDSFYRKAGQVGYNYILGSRVTHDLHVGFQRQDDAEDRFQTSNGWGLIQVPAGIGSLGTCPGTSGGVVVCGVNTPAFFVAQVSQQGARGVPSIHSEINTTNLEFNDTIRMNNWTFNVGLLDSQDTLYGQGLAKADNVAGFVASPGTKYLMHRFSFKDMLQPRLGATWAYNGQDTVFASYARYMPPANSDARAASWDRNLVQQLNVYFDATGNLIGVAPNASSSGKWWQDGIKHPEINEITVGTAKQLTSRWSGRLYTRYRKGTSYLEDTNNTARSDFNAPAGTNTAPYVPNLGNTTTPGTIRYAIGSGSSYVIANLDGAFTKYYEATAESEWRGDALFLSGSYTLSHYYGNFDQDNSSFSFANDAAVFIGSSNIGDGAGRQLWDFKYGDLRGDRRNVVKLNGVYTLPWHATTGAFGVYQSGQPYQLESVLPYRALTGSANETNRYAEPAGRRKSPEHHQLDWNYTQNIGMVRSLNLQLALDVFNVFNSQTGYNYETRIGVLGFTTRTDVPTVDIPTSISQSVLDGLKVAPGSKINAPYANSFYAPRRYQITARVQF